MKTIVKGPRDYCEAVGVAIWLALYSLGQVFGEPTNVGKTKHHRSQDCHLSFGPDQRKDYALGVDVPDRFAEKVKAVMANAKAERSICIRLSTLPKEKLMDELVSYEDVEDFSEMERLDIFHLREVLRNLLEIQNSE